MQPSSRISVNVGTQWLGDLVRLGINVALLPFLLGILGKDGFGLLRIVASIIAFTTVVDLGLRAALGRHVAAEVALNNEQRVNEITSTALLLYVFIGSLCAVFCIVAAPWLAVFFNAPPHLMPQALFLIRIYGSASILISFIRPVYQAVLASKHRFDLINYIAMATGIGQGVAMFLVIGLTDLGLYGWSLVMLVQRAVSLAALAYLAYRLWPAFRLGVRHIRRRAFRPLFSLGGAMFAVRLAGELNARANPLILGRILGLDAVALFSSGASMPQWARPSVKTMTNQLHTMATDFHVTGRKEYLHALLIRGTKYTLLMSVVVCVVLGVFARPIVGVWLGRTLGPEDCQLVAYVLMLWTAVELIDHAGGTQWPVLLGVGRLTFLAILQGVGSVVIVGAAIVLTYLTRSILAVIVPTIAVRAILRLILIVHTARRSDMPVGRYVKEAYRSPLLTGAALFGVAVVIRLLLRPESVLAVLGSAAATGLAWVPLTWWVGFNQHDRGSFVALFKRTVAAVRRGGKAPPGAGEAAEQAALPPPGGAESLEMPMDDGYEAPRGENEP